MTTETRTSQPTGSKARDRREPPRLGLFRAEEPIGPRWGRRLRNAGLSLLCTAGCSLGVCVLYVLAKEAGPGALCYLAAAAIVLLGAAALHFGVSVFSYLFGGRAVDLGGQLSFSCPHCYHGWGMFLPGEGEVEHCPSCNELVRG